MYKNSKFKVGDKVWHNGEVKTIKRVYYWPDGSYSYYFHENDERLPSDYERDLELYEAPHEKLLDLGFEKVAKHKYIKHHKGESDYDTPYKIIIEFAFNSYHIKCVGKNWIEVNTELAEILVGYLEELKNEKI